MSEENVATVRQAFEAWNAGDVEAVIGLLDPQFEFVPFRSQLHGAPYLGAEGMRQFARDAADDWEYLRIVPGEFRDAGDHVLMFASFDARGRTSGVHVEFPAAWVARLRSGKLLHLRAYSDHEAALAAAGLSE